MKKMVVAVFAVVSLFGCGNGSESADSSAKASSLASNTVWPYTVTGTVDIIDSGVGDSDYANWAIGTISVGGEDMSIEFESSVLEQADIDLEFNFSNPATIQLGEPKKQYGELTYLVKKIM